jgi:NAD(P)-dependent dehydrogenase (short-subunit alcohol dehydrogenase family)
MARWFVTGVGKGLGKSIFYELRRRNETVIGTVRTADNEGLILDQTKPIELELEDHIDVLILNAAVKDKGNSLTADPEQALHVMNTNAIGSLRVLQAVVPYMRPGGKIIMMSSQFGAIGMSGAITLHGNEGTHFIPATYSLGYRMSKAALHKLVQCTTEDLRGQGISVMALDPGWPKTDMGGEFATMNPDEVASDILDTIIATSILQTGTFIDWSGRQLKW